MSTIQNVFQQAQLAEAAYANFLDPNISYLKALTNGGMSPVQATAFLADWSVVSQQPNTESKGSASHLISNNHATSPTH